MTHSLEHTPTPDDDHLLDDFEFAPDPPPIEEQELALLDLQQRFMNEWVNDPNGFMLWLIRRADAYIDSTNRLVHLSLGLRHTEGALGERIQEQIVIHAFGRRSVPSLIPGNKPNTQYVNDYIPLVTTRDGTTKLSRDLKEEHATLFENQIERLRQLREFCPNLDDDLMTIVPTPGKKSVRIQHSDAYVATRSEQ